MASTINATTSSGIVATADNTGSLALQSAGTTVATINSTGVNAGIQMGAAFAPAFSAYRATTNQSISNATATKVQLNTEEFDTNSNFDSTTNYRFTPTVAGYYQINGGIGFNATTMTLCIIFLYKNGSGYKRGTQIAATQSTDSVGVVSALIYFNGSTDYVELYGYINATVGSPIYVGSSDLTYLNGSFVRSA